VRFGERTARVVLTYRGDSGVQRTEVVLQSGAAKLIRHDGTKLGALRPDSGVPRVCVFAPDHLELVKGPAGIRRAHLDEVVSTVWPARRATRASYARALAQRNSLVGRVRAGGSTRSALAAWDRELARHGIELMRHRADAVGLIGGRFGTRAGELGLPAPAEVEYRPRSKASDAAGLERELGERTESDLERGFTTHGPHRDDVALRASGRDLRRYGSQGQQRLSLLSLLLAERDVIGDAHGTVPVLLLDDVMSELDPTRRRLLLELVAAGGQTLITTADEGALPLRLGEVVQLERAAADPAAAPTEVGPAA
jgi:DNA replication and repair protein RecF